MAELPSTELLCIIPSHVAVPTPCWSPWFNRLSLESAFNDEALILVPASCAFSGVRLRRVFPWTRVTKGKASLEAESGLLPLFVALVGNAIAAVEAGTDGAIGALRLLDSTASMVSMIF